MSILGLVNAVVLPYAAALLPDVIKGLVDFVTSNGTQVLNDLPNVDILAILPSHVQEMTAPLLATGGGWLVGLGVSLVFPEGEERDLLMRKSPINVERVDDLKKSFEKHFGEDHEFGLPDLVTKITNLATTVSKYFNHESAAK